MRAVLNGKWLVAVVALACCSVGANAADAALISYYQLNGNLNDSTTSGNNGTAVGGTATFVSGYNGQGLQTGGAGEAHFTVPINISYNVNPAITIGGWFQATDASAIRTLFANDNGGFGRGVTIDNRGELVANAPNYSAFNGGGVTGGATPTGGWDFVAVTYNGNPGTVTLDVNGTFYTSSESSPAGDPFLSIGQSASFDLPFVGTIDNVFVFNTALSQADLLFIQATGTLPEPSTYVMLGVGAVGLVGAVRRRRKA